MRWSRDSLIAAVVIGLSFTPWVRDKGTILGWDSPQRPFDLLAATLVVAQGLPLAVRTRYPVLGLTLVSAAFSAYQLMGFRPTFASVALYLMLFTAGARQRRLRWVTVGAWVVGYAGLCAAFVLVGASPVIEYVYYFAIPAACWLGGSWARGEVLRREEQQRHEMESRLRDEREHLARELHDVVTHHVTAMIMQADAARFVPADDRSGLRAIGDTGRRALTDLRQLLNVLSPTGEAPRTPSTGRIVELVEQTRLAGQPIELVTEGEIDSAVAYRVVQEALTNALKHAPGRATVVRATPSSVEVSTAGPSAPGWAPGRGLDGLRRRVRLVGGDLDVHQDAGGAFVVRATL